MVFLTSFELRKMSTIRNLDKYKADLESLISLGKDILLDLEFSHPNKKSQRLSMKKKVEEGYFRERYQSWYTESCILIKQLIPDRLGEFETLYKGDGKQKVINKNNYNIQDFCNGINFSPLHFDRHGAIVGRVYTQFKILESSGKRFESTLFDIKQLVQADVFDSEVESSRELIKCGFLRAAGAVSGVILEKHLAQVLDNHRIKIRKNNSTISDFNEILKKKEVIDIPVWRQIQRIADIRNLCDHNKKREPTVEEVEEMVNSVDGFIKKLF